MKKYSFIIAFFITSSIFSQNYFRGVVLDSETKQPIPYCNVYIKGKVGSVSNQKGQCLLNIEKTFDRDSIIISNILYHKKSIAVKDFLVQKQSDTLYLKPQIYMLPEVAIEDAKVKCRIVEKGVKKVRFRGGCDRDVDIRPQKGMREQVAVFIENDFSEQKTVKLTSVKYNIIDSSKAGFLFRVHIYMVDNNKFIPGEELLIDNVIERHPMTNGWVEIDLRTYGIKMPKKGLFVAIEFLDYYIPELEKQFSQNKTKHKSTKKQMHEEYEKYEKEMNNINYYKNWLLLRQTEYKHRKNLTWFYGVRSGWKRVLPLIKNSISDNACISAKFSVCK